VLDKNIHSAKISLKQTIHKQTNKPYTNKQTNKGYSYINTTFNSQQKLQHHVLVLTHDLTDLLNVTRQAKYV